MNQIFDFFKDHAFLSKLLIFLIIIAVGVIAVKLILIPVKKILLKAKIDHTVKTFTFSFVKIALYTIVVLIALTNVGVEINSIITAIGAATVAASLALQNTLSNFVSGVILLMTKPFTAGQAYSRQRCQLLYRRAAQDKERLFSQLRRQYYKGQERYSRCCFQE